MSLAQKKASAANVFNITGGWENFQPVFSLMMLRGRMIVQLKPLLKPIKKEGGGGDTYIALYTAHRWIYNPD